MEESLWVEAILQLWQNQNHLCEWKEAMKFKKSSGASKSHVTEIMNKAAVKKKWWYIDINACIDSYVEYEYDEN